MNINQNGMKKWERNYSICVQNPNDLDSKISNLQVNIWLRQANKEDIKELARLKRIKENLPKVKNVLEYKEKIEQDIKNMEQELAGRKNKNTQTEKNDQAIQQLEEELNKLQDEKKDLKAQLKSEQDKTEQARIKAKLSAIDGKINENSTKYANLFSNTNRIETINETENTDKKYNKLKNVSNEELQNRILNLKTKVSKCNMICNNLMQGKSWDAIEVNLDNWQLRGKQKEKVENLRNARENGEQQEQNINQENTSLVEYEEGSFITRLLNKMREKRMQKKEDKLRRKDMTRKERRQDKKEARKRRKEERRAIRNHETVETAVTKTSREERDDFNQYIKDVAEKGMRQADKEAYERKMQELKQKLANRDNEHEL